MSGDTLRLDGYGQPASIAAEEPHDAGVAQRTDEALAPAVMLGILEQAPLAESTVEPPAEKLTELNTKSLELGEARIADKAELEASLALHDDAKLDAKAPIYQNEAGQTVQDTKQHALVSLALERLGAKADTIESARKTVDILKNGIAELDVNNLAQAPTRILLESALRAAQISLASHAGMPVQVKTQLDGLQGKTQEVQLRSLNELSATWRAMNTQVTDTIRLLSSPEEQQAEVRLNGTPLLPEDAAQCRDMMCKAGASMLRNALVGSPVAGKFSDKALELVGRMALESGEAPGAMLHAVELAMQGVVGPANAHDTRALEGILDGMLTASNPRDKAGYVDMLFMGAYPQGSDAALTLKKALVAPELREGMACFHSFVMSRHVLLNGVFKGISGKTDIGAQLSARTFLLTPDLASKLCDSTSISNFKYHMAHVAMLQARAIQDGFLDEEFSLPRNYASLPSEKQQELSASLKERTDVHQTKLSTLTDMKAWGETLGLQDYVAEAAQRLNAPDQADAFAEKVALAADRFNKGFAGDSDLMAADKAVQRTAGMTNHMFSSRYERNIYHTNSEFMAHKVLDDCVMNLTGILEPEKRLIADVNVGKNADIVDTAIRSKLGSLLHNPDSSSLSLKEQAMFGQLDEEISNLTEYRDARLDEIKGARRPFLKHVRTMQEMAAQTNELVRLHAEEKKLGNAHNALKTTWESLSFSWPHQRAGRTRVCDKVMQIADLHETITEINSELDAAKSRPVTDAREQARLDELESRKQDYLKEEIKLLRDLKGVNVAAMNYSGKRNGPVPDLETVLTVMRPRAEAVRYFTSGEADKVYKEVESIRAKTDACIERMNELTGIARKVYGADTLRQLGTAIRAAALKVFVESGLRVENFSASDPAVRTSIEKQLDRWGVQADKGYFATLVTKELYCLCDSDGHLRMDALRWQDANFQESMAVAEAKGDMLRQHIIDHGFSLTSDIVVENELDERRDAALRKHGVHTLMEAATTPGGGFVYDYKRGFAISNGLSFSEDEELVQPISSLPLSLQLGFLHSDALTVNNAGNGTFSVTLKSENAASIAVSLGMMMGNVANVSLSGNASAGKAGGIYLYFPSQETCETFLNDFMNPSSDLHKGGGSQPSWLAAHDIRLLEETSASASLAMDFSVGNFSEGVSLGAMGSVLGVNVSLSGNVQHSTSRNVHGTTDTLRRQFAVSASANLFTIGVFANLHVKLSEALSTEKELPKEWTLFTNELTPASVIQTFTMQTGMEGLKPESSMSMEMSKGKHDLLEGLALLHLPESTMEALGKDATQLTELAEAWASAPPDATMKVNWKLRPETLEKAHSLVVQARAASGEKRTDLMREYHEMLGKFESYVPTSLQVLRKEEYSIANNSVLPELFLGIKRETGFTGLQEDTYSLAPRQKAS